MNARQPLPQLEEPPVIRRAALLVAAALLCWQIVTLNLADHFTERAKKGDTQAIDLALRFNPEHATALRLKASHLTDQWQASPETTSPIPIIETLRQSLRSSQLETRAVGALLATETIANIGLPNIEGLQALGDTLAPVSPGVQRDLLIWSLGRDDAASSVQHASRALIGDQALSETLFPLLAELASDPGASAQLNIIAEDPRQFIWWMSFLEYVANTPGHEGLFTHLISVREASAHPLTSVESELYIKHLRTLDRYTEAYLFWVNRLDEDALLKLGYVFDGGFDTALNQDNGFGWQTHSPNDSRTQVSVSDRFGASDATALRVSFNDHDGEFRDIGQTLLLPSGSYRVTGRVRPEQLEIRIGLQWSVRCIAPDYAVLGRSEPFKGTGEWRDFEFEAEVTPDCKAQEIRLQSAGVREVDHQIDGRIWFDDLRVERVP